MFGSMVSWYHDRCGGLEGNRSTADRPAPPPATGPADRALRVEAGAARRGRWRDVLRAWPPPGRVDPPQCAAASVCWEALYADGDAVHPGALIINEGSASICTGLASMVISAPRPAAGRRRHRAGVCMAGPDSRLRRTAADKNSAYFPSPGIVHQPADRSADAGRSHHAAPRLSAHANKIAVRISARTREYGYRDSAAAN